MILIFDLINLDGLINFILILLIRMIKGYVIRNNIRSEIHVVRKINWEVID